MVTEYRIGCLFGSGISLKAHYLNVKEITNAILNGKIESDGVFYKAYHHTDKETYLLNNNSNEHINDHFLDRVLPFINNVKSCLDDYFKVKRYMRNPNYEDIYCLIRQIMDEISQEQDNYGIFNSIPMLKDKLILNIPRYKHLGSKNSNNLNSISKDSLNYIENIVQRLLYRTNSVAELEYLSILKGLIEKNMDTIFTLNHDTLLEQYFSLNNIRYCDGFAIEDGDVLHFDETSFASTAALKLFKLHGSVDWFRLTNKQGTTTYSKLLTNDSHHIKDSRENLYYKNGFTNQMLVGSFNKLTDYNFGIYDILNSEFTHHLRELQVLIVSGYSFSDKGVNGRLKYWFEENNQRKIIIVHPNKKFLISDCRGMIYWILLKESNKLNNNKRIYIIEKKFEDLIIEDIDSIMNNSD